MERERPRGKRGFRQAGGALRGDLVARAGRRGFAEPEVLLRWPEIVGADLAAACRPVSISHGRGPSLGATLLVEVEGARATEIEHRASAIVERINAYYGYRAVSRLRLTQAAGAPDGFAEARAGFAHRDRVEEGRAEARAAAEAERLAAPIRDDGLRGVLTRLGTAILARPENRDPTRATAPADIEGESP